MYQTSTLTHLILNSDCFELYIIDQTASRDTYALAPDSSLSNIKFSAPYSIETSICETLESSNTSIEKYNCKFSVILTINEVP